MRCFTALSMTSPRVISSPICSVRYIIPSIRRASTLIVKMKGKKKWYTTCILFLIQYLRLCTFATRVEEHCMQRTLQPGEPPTRLFVLSYSFAIMSAGCSLIILRMCTPTTSATTSETIEILIIMGITGETSSLGIPCCIPHSCNNVLKITIRGMLITLATTTSHTYRRAKKATTSFLFAP